MSTPVPEVLWRPDPQHAAASGIAEFTRYVRDRRGVSIPDGDYAALHAWSVRDLAGFWSAVAEFAGVRFHQAPAGVLGAERMPGAEWFPGATLNYAEHVLRPGPGRGDGDVAVVFVREDGLERQVTWAELRDLVGRCRAGLASLGVARGDRVVALAPNCVETLAGFLAAASLGAVWSSCSPDFGVRAVRDRFAQIEPAVMIAVDGCRYGGKSSMPVAFWDDPDGSRLREAYFDPYPGVWRYGDWVRVTPRGSYVIYGRSDATLNRGGVRMGTADFYAVVEGFDEVADSLVIDTTELGADQGQLLCFLVPAPGVTLTDIEPQLRRTLRSELSPRHVPDRFIVIDEVPRTLSGKKLEVPVKKILAGAPAGQAVSKEALQNPEALAPFLELGRNAPA
jgi:acyl-coenzyme A synthetase/AMP-(fatty) acid ligase